MYNNKNRNFNLKRFDNNIHTIERYCIIFYLYASRNSLAKFLHIFELMGNSVPDIFTKPPTSVSDRVLEGFVGYFDISVRSPFPRWYSLKTNENIWPLLLLSSSGSSLCDTGG